MKLTLLLFAFTLIVTTVLPLIRSDRWWIRIFDFPRSQILWLSIAVAGGYYYYWDPSDPVENIFLSIFGIAVLYQSYMVFPYSVFSRVQVRNSESGNQNSCVSVLIANVLMYNQNSDLLLGTIWREAPDIIALIEPNRWWERQVASLDAEYPYSVRVPLENTYGIILYSKLKLIGSRVRYMVEDDVPSIRTAVELRSGDIIDLFCVHPKPPHPLYGESTAFRDAELLMVGKQVRRSRRPVIVIGDLNDVAWSTTTILFKRISGLLDPRIGRGLFNTFHAGFPFFRWPLDHVFHTKHFRVQAMQRLKNFGSDHFPIAIRLSLEALATIEHIVPPAQREDHQEAEALIERIEEVKEVDA